MVINVIKKIIFLFLFVLLNITSVYALDTGFYLYDKLEEEAVPDNISSTYVTSDTGINFSLPSSSTNGRGLYILHDTLDNEKKIIYYRGKIDNNFIIFENYCWQIIRTTDDGSFKLIFAGTPTDNKCLAVDQGMWILENKVKFNLGTTTNDLGYMISDDDGNVNALNSNIKTEVDNWFSANFQNNLDHFSDTIFCNDREYETVNTHYLGWKRLQEGTPDYHCHDINDSFSVTDIGNGKLQYPVALINTDELIYAGAQYAEVDPDNYYDSWTLLHAAYWAMTPNSSNKILYPNSLGYINRNSTNASSGVRPVIAISIDTYLLSGDGTRNNPYRVPNQTRYKIEADEYLDIENEDAIENQMIKVLKKGKTGFDFVQFKFYDDNDNEKKVDIVEENGITYIKMPNYNLRVVSVWREKASLNPKTSARIFSLLFILIVVSICTLFFTKKRLLIK